MHWTDRIGAGLVSGLIAGFAVLGIGGRIAMRLIAMAEGQRLTFTSRGTFGVLLVFCFIGLILSIPYATLQRYMPSSNLRKGATFGLLLMLVIVWAIPLAITVAQQDAAALNFASIVARMVFSVLFLGYGVLLAIVNKQLFEIELSPGP